MVEAMNIMGAAACFIVTLDAIEFARTKEPTIFGAYQWLWWPVAFIWALEIFRQLTWDRR